MSDQPLSADSPPTGGWAPLMPELCVTDLDASTDFWCGPLGFSVAYRRPEEGFVFLQRDGAQVMLCRRNGRFETGPMVPPLGQGVLFQIAVSDLAAILAALADRDWPLYETPREVWFRVGSQETGNRQACVQDPDGYLLLLAEDLGVRPRHA